MSKKKKKKNQTFLALLEKKGKEERNKYKSLYYLK